LKRRHDALRKLQEAEAAHNHVEDFSDSKDKPESAELAEDPFELVKREDGTGWDYILDTEGINKMYPLPEIDETNKPSSNLMVIAEQFILYSMEAISDHVDHLKPAQVVYLSNLYDR
ncbi:hypothetical protein H0H87_001117, partial [Tephrocybe sp. NHM501043]